MLLLIFNEEQMFELSNYNFVFFDFDGLLVNTEHLHFEAYKNMCLSRGFILPWNFLKYCSIAHTSAEGLRKEIYREFPALYEQEPNWSVLYEEKKEAYKNLLDLGTVQLMPGVEQLFFQLESLKIPSCVVTNSFKKQIDRIREQLPILEKIPYWVTREDYKAPKPSPDPYLVAKSTYALPTDRIIGFEDSIRGMQALVDAGIEGIVISSCLDESMQKQLNNVVWKHSFLELLGIDKEPFLF